MLPMIHPRPSWRRFRLLSTAACAVFSAALSACSEQAVLTAPDSPARPSAEDSLATPTPTTPVTPAPPARDVYTLLFDQWGTDAASFERPWLAHTTTPVGGLPSEDVPAETPADTVRRVMDFSGVFDASVSSDGRLMVFTCTTGHGTTLCKATLDSVMRAQMPGAILSTAFSALLADQAAISPDGTQVAFRGWQPGGPVGLFNPGDIYVMNLDGSNLTRLTAAERGRMSYASPAWSPRRIDGAYRLAYAREQRDGDGYAVSRLESMRADGTAMLALTIDTTGSDTEPAWSPDGARVAFVRRGAAARGDLWAVQLDGHARPVAEHALLENELDDVQRAPSWSPDGKRLAFISAHEILGDFYNWQVYSVDASGTDLRRHTSVAREHANPVWVSRTNINSGAAH